MLKPYSNHILNSRTPKNLNGEPYQRRFLRFVFRAAASLLVTLLIGVPEANAQSMNVSENQIKAVYLFNLTGFIGWPASAFVSSDAPLMIAVAGSDRAAAFVSLVSMVTEGETAGGRPIIIKRLPAGADPAGFHILFISTWNEKEIERLMNSVRNKPVLTVSDREGFCRRGGMINLVRRKNRIGIEANIDAARAARLQISSKLIRVAALVGGSGTE